MEQRALSYDRERTLALPRALAAGEAPPAPQGEPNALSLTEGLAVIRRRLGLVLTTAAAFIGVAIAYCALSPSLFSARATIEIRGYAPAVANLTSEALFGTDSRKVEYQRTTVAKLSLAGVADYVLSTAGLDRELDRYWRSQRSLFRRAYASIAGEPSGRTPLLANGTDTHYVHAPAVLRKYQSLISITPIHETNLVSIEATTTDPALSQRIANTHALGFIAHLRQERSDSIASNASLLSRQAADLKARVTAAEQELAEYASTNRLLALRQDEGPTANMRQIEAMAAMLAEAIGRRIKSESLLKESQGKRSDQGSVADDEVTRQLRVSLSQAETERAAQSSRLMAAHPVMLELTAKVDSLRGSIQEERRRAMRTLQAQFDADLAAEQRLREQIESERASAQEAAQRLIQYNVLSKEASSLRELYQTVLKQAKEVEISAATATSNVFITDYASLPTSPSAPRSGVIVLLFSALGLSAGLLAALAAESFKGAITTGEEAQGALLLPLLAAIPPLGAGSPPLPSEDSGEPGRSEGHRAAAHSPPRLLVPSLSSDPVTEALRSLRASILLSSADHPPRAIMVSSPQEGDGKTTIVANLASILTQGGYRVVAIDGDMRVGALGDVLRDGAGSAAVGLSDVLTGQAALEQALAPSRIPGLDLIGAGNTPPDPAELLGSNAMRQLVGGLVARYDFVLIDSPPILPVSDCLMLSRVVECAILVLRSGATQRTHAVEARRRLLAAHARILGVVLNDICDQSTALYTSMYGARPRV